MTELTKISVDDFVGFGGDHWIPGRKIAITFGFDPDKCLTNVDSHDTLIISQEGLGTTHLSAREFWRRTSDLKDRERILWLGDVPRDSRIIFVWNGNTQHLLSGSVFRFMLTEFQLRNSDRDILVVPSTWAKEYIEEDVGISLPNQLIDSHAQYHPSHLVISDRSGYRGYAFDENTRPLRLEPAEAETLWKYYAPYREGNPLPH